MKIMYQTLAVVLVSLELVLTTGCVNQDGTQNNTGTGALMGGTIGAIAGVAGGGRHAGEHALIDATAGAITGGLIGYMIDLDQEQQRRLRQQSPQTLETIQHNNEVARQQQQATPSSQTQPQTTETTFTPLTVDDIKALTSAGVKPEAIIKEIDISHSQYSSQDIAAAQQAKVDSSVIDCMNKHLGNLVAKATAKVVNKSSDRLYPSRIASIEADGNVIIDQGGDRFVTGTLLDVFKAADADTNEIIGSTEILVATIRIDKVAPAMSYCSVVSGDTLKLSQGLVCRPKPLPARELGGMKSNVERTPQGGVKLPSDK